MPRVRVGHSWWNVSERVILENLPEIYMLTPFGDLDISTISQVLSQSLPGRISHSSARPVLQAFFNILRHRSAKYGEVIPRLYELLDNALRKDLNRMHLYGGLPKCRTYFITLALLAQLAMSLPMANALVEFFWEQRHHAVLYEHTGDLPDWVNAINSLRGLARHDDVNRALRYIARKGNDIGHHYHNSSLHDPLIEQAISILQNLNGNGICDLDRGRRWQRLRYRHTPRAKTAPPQFYRPRPLPPTPNYLHLPTPNPIAYPLLSPTHSMNTLDDVYRDVEMEQMKIDQAVLQEKVQELEDNQEEISYEIGMHDPLAISTITGLPTIGF